MLLVSHSLPVSSQNCQNISLFLVLLQLFLGIVVCMMSLHMYFAPPSMLIDLPKMINEDSESLLEVCVDRRIDLMKPKYSPVRYTILTLEQPVFEKQESTKKRLLRGGPVWSRPNTLRRLSQKMFLQLQSAREGLVTHTFFEGVGAFLQQ